MPGRVITVDRKTRRSGKLGWVTRSYLPGIARGLAVTARHFFRNLRGFATGKNRRDFVVQYPEEQLDLPDAFRGMPVLVALEDGSARCVACGLCEFACPTHCIEIVPGELEGAAIERYPLRFDIDMSRCMLCGLCEEACPEEAIVMSPAVELATFTREEMIFTKEQLLVPAAGLQRRLDFLRSEYDHEYAAPVPRNRGSGMPLPQSDHGSIGLRRLLAILPECVVATHADHGDATALVVSERICDVMRLLRDDRYTRFEMLSDLCAVDHLGRRDERDPNAARFEVVYHLRSVSRGDRLRIKAGLPDESLRIPSITSLWPAANWMEREVWDLYGIVFTDHPDPRRLLLYEEFDGHPLRKDYPKRGRQPLVGPRN